MRSLNIKNVPDEIHVALKQLAHQHRRSLNGQVLKLFEDAVGRGRSDLRPDADDLLKRAAALRSRCRGALTTREIEAAIRRGRP